MRQAIEELRDATKRLRGDHAPELTEIDSFLDRLRRYQRRYQN